MQAQPHQGTHPRPPTATQPTLLPTQPPFPPQVCMGQHPPQPLPPNSPLPTQPPPSPAGVHGALRAQEDAHPGPRRGHRRDGPADRLADPKDDPPRVQGPHNHHDRASPGHHHLLGQDSRHGQRRAQGARFRALRGKCVHMACCSMCTEAPTYPTRCPNAISPPPTHTHTHTQEFDTPDNLLKLPWSMFNKLVDDTGSHASATLRRMAAQGPNDE